MRYRNAIDEVSNLAAFVQGLAAGAAMKGDLVLEEKLFKAAEWLERTSRNVCGEGMIGCEGGSDCGSDHK